MFATLQNMVQIDFSLVPDGPILVRAQTTGLDPGVAEQEFQRTTRNGRPTVFLAGSGLKGALRSHCERLLRTAGVTACDPTKMKDRNTCGRVDNLHTSSLERPFANQCAACITFGSAKLSGRFQVRDAYPARDYFDQTNRVEARTQVGLDRKTQGPATGTLFDVEAVTAGAFSARIDGESFSLWQLALILQALRDLNSGFLRIGGMKSRGMGAVKVDQLTLRFLSLAPIDGRLTGAESVSARTPGYAWGMATGDAIALPSDTSQEDVETGTEGLFNSVLLRGEALEALTDDLIRQSLRPFLTQRARR